MSPTGQEFYWQETEVASNSRGKVLALHFSFGKWSGIQHDGSRAIQEVIIGPKNKTLESEVVALLLENGYSDFVVRRSHCAIR
jgi:hypothetical protein